MRIITGVFVCVALCWHSDRAQACWDGWDDYFDFSDLDVDWSDSANLTDRELQLAAEERATQQRQEQERLENLKYRELQLAAQEEATQQRQAQQEPECFDAQTQKLLEYDGREFAKLQQLYAKYLYASKLTLQEQKQLAFTSQEQEQLAWLISRECAYSNLDRELRNTLWLLRRELTPEEWKLRWQLEQREHELLLWLGLYGPDELELLLNLRDDERKEWLKRLKDDFLMVDWQLREEQCYKDLSDTVVLKNRVELQLERLKLELLEIPMRLNEAEQEFKFEIQGLLERLEPLEQQREPQQERMEEPQLEQQRKRRLEKLERKRLAYEGRRESLEKQRLEIPEQARQFEQELLEIQARSSNLKYQVKQKRCELSDPVRLELRVQQQLERSLQDLLSEPARRPQDGSLDPKLENLEQQLARSKQRLQVLQDPAKQEQLERDFAQLKQRLAERQTQRDLEWSWTRHHELTRQRQLAPYEQKRLAPHEQKCLEHLQALLVPLSKRERDQLERARQIFGGHI
jgi:hypothetical protein